MREIELRKCYEEYEWRHCTISNHDVKLFDCKYDAVDYLDRYHELYIQTPSNWDIRDYEGRRVEPSKWLREETKNEKYGVITLRTDWGLGIMENIVAYKRDKTYLDLMSKEDRQQLLDVLQGDDWRQIRVIGITEDDCKYPVDIDVYPADVKSMGVEEWIRENLYIRHKFSHYAQSIGSSDFKFDTGEYEKAEWYFYE